MFHNLYRGTSELPDTLEKTMGTKDSNRKKDEIYSTSAYKMEDLTPNHIIIARADKKVTPVFSGVEERFRQFMDLQNIRNN